MTLQLQLDMLLHVHVAGENSTSGIRESADSGGIVVSGHRVQVDQKSSNAPSRPLSSKATGKMQKAKAPQRQKVRNYNVKDDSGFR